LQKNKTETQTATVFAVTYRTPYYLTSLYTASILLSKAKTPRELPQGNDVSKLLQSHICFCQWLTCYRHHLLRLVLLLTASAEVLN